MLSLLSSHDQFGFKLEVYPRAAMFAYPLVLPSFEMCTISHKEVGNFYSYPYGNLKVPQYLI